MTNPQHIQLHCPPRHGLSPHSAMHTTTEYYKRVGHCGAGSLPRPTKKWDVAGLGCQVTKILQGSRLRDCRTPCRVWDRDYETAEPLAGSGIETTRLPNPLQGLGSRLRDCRTPCRVWDRDFRTPCKVWDRDYETAEPLAGSGIETSEPLAGSGIETMEPLAGSGIGTAELLAGSGIETTRLPNPL